MLDSLSHLQTAGFIQQFQFTFELGWKLLKDRMEHDGVSLPLITPRAVIKEAFAAKLIDDGDAWIAMLDDRNNMSHNYDEEKFAAVVENIRRTYLPALADLHCELEAELRR